MLVFLPGGLIGLRGMGAMVITGLMLDIGISVFVLLAGGF